jgi:hypothetical protein
MGHGQRQRVRADAEVTGGADALLRHLVDILDIGELCREILVDRLLNFPKGREYLHLELSGSFPQETHLQEHTTLSSGFPFSELHNLEIVQTIAPS